MRDEPAVLSLDGRAVASYAWRPDLPANLSPRPHLHPVRTLAGTAVTELMPTSHRHHLGASIAIADVDGHNFWGSRTFVAGHGPAWLRNHGTQEHVSWLRRTPTELAHTLRWMSIDQEQLLTERRTWTAQPVNPSAWALTCDYELTNASTRRLRIQSPAGVGRPGAGYGGFFWHAPSGPGPSRAMTSTHDNTESIHGSRAPWLAVSGSADWTLVFIAASAETRDDRWFLRTRDYLGIGSALSWDDPLLLDPGAAVHRRIAVLVADGTLSAADAARHAVGFAA